MKLIASISVLVMLPACQAQASAKHGLECPIEVSASAISIKAPDGWTPYAEEGVRLHSAEPVLGPPEEKAFLKPSNTKITKTGSIDSWNELGGPAPGGKWLVCRYGERGELILSKRLNDTTSACTVNNQRAKVEIFCTW